MFQIASFKIICTDSAEILFSKLRSAGLNYHLPKCKFFTFPYCAGVSNKHCLWTFFISSRCLYYFHLDVYKLLLIYTLEGTVSSQSYESLLECLYSKTCLKRPLKNKTKNWLSLQIIA